MKKIPAARAEATERRYTVSIRGVRPLITHNGALADPLNPIVKQMRELTSLSAKQKASDEVQEKLSRLEFRGGLYLMATPQGKAPCIPATNLEAMMRQGGAYSRRGKDFDAAASVDEDDVPIEYDGPRDPDELFDATDDGGNPIFLFRRRARVGGKQSVMRTRCRFPKWALTFTVRLVAGVGLSSADVERALREAGARRGLGDWAPRYGSFSLERFAEL